MWNQSQGDVCHRNCQRVWQLWASRILPVLLLLTLSAPAHAQTTTGTTANGLVYASSSGTVSITGYKGTGGAVSISGTINGLPVTSIGNSAFESTNLTSVTIPGSVTAIGTEAFWQCTSLTGITIPDNVTSIGSEAFWGCTSLTSGTIGNGVTSIQGSTFYGCNKLTSMKIGTSVTEIGNTAFYNCGLTSVTIPDSVTAIDSYAFESCAKLTSVSIGKGVTSIGTEAFWQCTSLTGITIPDNVTSIGSEAFWGCTSLKSAIFMGNAPTMGSSVFSSVASGFTVFYLNGRTGFNSPTWTDSVGDIYPAYCSWPTVSSTSQPVAALTTIQCVASTQLRVYDGDLHIFGYGGIVDTSKPTIVLTHGWNSSPDQFTDLAGAILSCTNVNILAWDWSGDADSGWNLGYSDSRIPNQGKALGQTLSSLLGSNYNNKIHFIGHSLGTMVNAAAINITSSNIRNAIIQDTLFDDAEVADITTCSWISPIPSPSTYEYIDNYVACIGYVHSQAINIVLDPPIGTNDVAFHGYPVTWYQNSVTGSSGFTIPTNAGFSISMIGNPSVLATGTYKSFANTYYEGATNGFMQKLLNETEAEVLLALHKETVALSSIGQVTAGWFSGIVQTSGSVALNLDSINGIIIPLTKATTVTSAVKVGEMTPAIQTTTGAPAYVWIPINIPAGAQTMTFNFTFNNLSAGDYLTAGINSTQVFALESQFSPNGQIQTSPQINVSQWAGQSVVLFLGLNVVDANNIGGNVTVQNITFNIGAPVSTITSNLSVTGTNGASIIYNTTATNSPTSFTASGLPSGLTISSSTGMILGTALQTGLFTVTINTINSSGTNSGTLLFTILDTINTWQQAHFNSTELTNQQICGNTACPANDNIPNLMKYAIGLDPHTPSVQGLPKVGVLTTGTNSFLTLKYNQYIFASGITLFPEVSSDLQTWQSGTGTTTVLGVSDNADGVTQSVIVQDLTPISSSSKRFIRLKVTKP